MFSHSFVPTFKVKYASYIELVIQLKEIVQVKTWKNNDQKIGNMNSGFSKTKNGGVSFHAFWSLILLNLDS